MRVPLFLIFGYKNDKFSERIQSLPNHHITDAFIINKLFSADNEA